ncbi:MAG: DUF485 domain-containing protein [Chthoniobacterales bacterium]
MPPSDDSPDLTPESAAPTDIAPLGRSRDKPEHEKTAVEDFDTADWNAIAEDSDFKALLASKARFIVPATIFFVIYYFTLPILVGWCPGLMEKKVWGSMNLAYAFALSQFFMAWILAFLYVAAAAGWDKKSAAIFTKFLRK